MVPKAYRLLRSITCRFSCGQTGGCRRVDARFALAFWTLAFRPLAVEKYVGPVGRLSPLALVVIGTCHGWRGMVRETTRSTVDNPTVDPTNSPDDYQEFLYEI